LDYASGDRRAPAQRAGEIPRISQEDASGERRTMPSPVARQDVIVSALAFAVLAGLNFGQFGGIPLLLLMFVAMYFLLIAPNQRKQKTWAAMLAALKTGDKVTTNGGIRGTIVSVKDDVLVIKTAPDGIKLEFVKSAIAAVTTEDVAKA
jgi:preprotein translocase subunit YajC